MTHDRTVSDITRATFIDERLLHRGSITNSTGYFGVYADPRSAERFVSRITTVRTPNGAELHASRFAHGTFDTAEYAARWLSAQLLVHLGYGKKNKALLNGFTEHALREWFQRMVAGNNAVEHHVEEGRQSFLCGRCNHITVVLRPVSINCRCCGSKFVRDEASGGYTSDFHAWIDKFEASVAAGVAAASRARALRLGASAPAPLAQDSACEALQVRIAELEAQLGQNSETIRSLQCELGGARGALTTLRHTYTELKNSRASAATPAAPIVDIDALRAITNDVEQLADDVFATMKGAKNRGTVIGRLAALVSVMTRLRELTGNA
jgi:transcription elongation factor Elf1